MGCGAGHAIRAVITMAAAALLLAGCSEAPAGAVADYAGEPHGVDAPARSAGGAEYAVWLDKGARFALTLYGSSSCPPVADTMRVTGANRVKVTLKPAPKGACTSNYAPHTSVFDTPSALRIGTNVTITIVRSTGAALTTLILPAYPG